MTPGLLNQAIFILLLVLTGRPGLAASVGCIEQELRALVEAGELLHQNNRALARASLIVQGGGLCGPTCAFNLFKAVDRQLNLGLSESGAVQEISNFYHKVVELTGKDIRLGTSGEDMAIAIRGRIRAAKVYAPLKISESFGVPLSVDDLLAHETSGFAMMSFESFDASGKHQGGHWVIPVSIDRKRHVMEIIDPNFPDRVMEVSYEPGKRSPDGRHPSPQLHLGHRKYEERGKPLTHYVSSVLSVEKPRLYRDPLKITGGIQLRDLVGKRVHVSSAGANPIEGVITSQFKGTYDFEPDHVITITPERGASKTLDLQHIESLRVLNSAGVPPRLDPAMLKNLKTRILAGEFRGKKIRVGHFRSLDGVEGRYSEVTGKINRAEDGISYFSVIDHEGQSTHVGFGGLQVIEVLDQRK